MTGNATFEEWLKGEISPGVQKVFVEGILEMGFRA
jgi:hypothetical protein